MTGILTFIGVVLAIGLGGCAIAMGSSYWRASMTVEQRVNVKRDPPSTPECDQKERSK